MSEDDKNDRNSLQFSNFNFEIRFQCLGGFTPRKLPLIIFTGIAPSSIWPFWLTWQPLIAEWLKQVFLCQRTWKCFFCQWTWNVLKILELLSQAVKVQDMRYWNKIQHSTTVRQWKVALRSSTRNASQHERQGYE